MENKDKIIFLRSNGEIATNAIVRRVNKKNGEVLFIEIIDLAREKIPERKIKINGKEIYQRILIQKVYPNIQV